MDKSTDKRPKKAEEPFIQMGIGGAIVILLIIAIIVAFIIGSRQPDSPNQDPYQGTTCLDNGGC